MTHRERLPDRRYSEGFDFEHAGIRYHADVGFHPDGPPAEPHRGRIGELFLSATRKVSSEADAIARDAAYVFSLALQYGCPLDSIRAGLLHAHDGTSAGVLGCAIDHIARRPRPPAPLAESVPAPPPVLEGGAAGVAETEGAAE